MYCTDPRLKQKTLEIELREASADNEGVGNIAFQATAAYRLERDLCSSFNLDSAAYNVAAVKRLKYFYRFMVAIYDPIHTLVNAMEAAFGVDNWDDVTQWMTKTRAIYQNSLDRKRDYRRYLKTECEPVCCSSVFFADCKHIQ